MDSERPYGSYKPVGAGWGLSAHRSSAGTAMSITEVKTHVLEAALSEPFHWAVGEAEKRSSCVVFPTTSE